MKPLIFSSPRFLSAPLSPPLTTPALEKDLFVIWRDTGANHISAPTFVPHLIGDDWVAGEPEQEHEQAAQ